jgi:hypothetical protein
MLYIVNSFMQLGPMREGLIAKGRNVVEIVPQRAIEDFAPDTDAQGIKVTVYRFIAQRLEGIENVPVHLVEIEETAPDRTYYHSVVLHVVAERPTDNELMSLVESEVLERRRGGITASDAFETWQRVQSH